MSACVLDVPLRCRYGLEEGALVLVSALGAPAESSVLQPAGGVLSALKAEQEIAADLAAAVAAAAAAVGGALAAAVGDDKEDVKVGVKHEREPDEGGGSAAEGQPQDKKPRLA